MAQLCKKLFQVPCRIFKKATTIRSISTTKCTWDSYEGDGKTTVTILNREHRHLIMFDSLTEMGFKLNNGIFVIGPVAAFPRTVLQWNVPSVEYITIESLSLFAVLEPKLDIFILGTGDHLKLPSPEVMNFLKSKKIAVEVLPTEKACATFNFLNVEGRCIGGAFMPPENVNVYEEDSFKLTPPKASPTGYIM
ncbi:NADH dehydrogenase 1 alpha like protein [Argiope bruennichi]|uniref:NADH dehydrogenase [ubiquinone] 1 alpha subcomplex assembly factor 3 n=1 Tax=Argiope bruennichi TaxID=94029 RepID=A0A8T0FP34_ARGBR|nr:NADH dehydrogenase 1 alpha like protein [Argiope bruennichi]